jgi:hypothetical protein
MSDFFSSEHTPEETAYQSAQIAGGFGDPYAEAAPDDWAVTPHDSAGDPMYQAWRAAQMTPVRPPAPEYPPGTPMVTNEYETYPAVVTAPPATVAGLRVLAWAEAVRRDGEYPGGVVLCVQPGRPAVFSTEWVPEYVTWTAYTKDGGRTWAAELGHYTDDYATAWADFTERAQRCPATA